MICGAGRLTLARKSPEGDVLGLVVFLHYAHGPLEMGAQVYSRERDFQALVRTLAGEEDFPLRPVDLSVLSQMFWEALTFEFEDEGSLEEEGVLLSSLVRGGRARCRSVTGCSSTALSATAHRRSRRSIQDVADGVTDERVPPTI